MLNFPISAALSSDWTLTNVILGQVVPGDRRTKMGFMGFGLTLGLEHSTELLAGGK